MSDTKPSKSAPTYQWFEEEMVWKRRKGRARVWVAESPPLPEWAASGAVAPAQFVRLYTAAASISELKSQLFWLSLAQIEALRLGVNVWLAENDIQPLAPLGASPALLSEEDVEALLADSTLAPVPGSSLDVRLNPPPEEDELDLTPTPPRPNEDPLQGKTFNEIMHIPEAKNEKQLVTMMGMGKVRFTGKH